MSNEGLTISVNTPSWVYNSNYWYWTMSPDNDNPSIVLCVGSDGVLERSSVNGAYNVGSIRSGVVRPVIVLPKSAL